MRLLPKWPDYWREGMTRGEYDAYWYHYMIVSQARSGIIAMALFTLGFLGVAVWVGIRANG